MNETLKTPIFINKKRKSMSTVSRERKVKASKIVIYHNRKYRYCSQSKHQIRFACINSKRRNRRCACHLVFNLPGFTLKHQTGSHNNHCNYLYSISNPCDLNFSKEDLFDMIIAYASEDDHLDIKQDKGLLLNRAKTIIFNLQAKFSLDLSTCLVSIKLLAKYFANNGKVNEKELGLTMLTNTAVFIASKLNETNSIAIGDISEESIFGSSTRSVEQKILTTVNYSVGYNEPFRIVKVLLAYLEIMTSTNIDLTYILLLYIVEDYRLITCSSTLIAMIVVDILVCNTDKKEAVKELLQAYKKEFLLNEKIILEHLEIVKSNAINIFGKDKVEKVARKIELWKTSTQLV